MKICERHDLRHFWGPDVLRVKCTSSSSTASLSPGVPWLDLIGGTCLACHNHKLSCCLMRNNFDSTTYSSRGCFIRGGIAFDFMIWRPSSLHSAVAFSSIAHETKILRGKNPTEATISSQTWAKTVVSPLFMLFDAA